MEIPSEQKERIRELYRTPHSHVPALQTAAIIALYTGSCLVIQWLPNLAFRIPLWLLNSLILVGITSLIHDCIHSHYTASKAGNRVAGAIAAAIIFSNYSLHRRFHMKHHRHTTMAGDPEGHVRITSVLMYCKTLIISGTPFNRVFRHNIAWSFRSWLGRFPDYVTDGQAAIKIDHLALMSWVSLTLALTILAPTPMLLFWWIPFALYFPAKFFIMLPEHEGTLNGPDPFQNTRTIRSNAIIHFLYWNNNFHAEHHAFPGVPYYHLPRAHEILCARLGQAESGYVAYHINLIRAQPLTHPKSQ